MRNGPGWNSCTRHYSPSTMTDWSAARTFTGDPADVFVAYDELLELLRPPA